MVGPVADVRPWLRLPDEATADGTSSAEMPVGMSLEEVERQMIVATLGLTLLLGFVFTLSRSLSAFQTVLFTLFAAVAGFVLPPLWLLR